MKISVNTTGVTTQGLIGKRVEHAQTALGMQVLKDTEPYVPMLTGSLKNRSQYVRDSHSILYPGPYARYLYHGKYMVDSKTGKGPMHYTSKDGTEYIRYRKGAVLKPTERDLKFNTSRHPLAQSHWIEASKTKNIDKWKRLVQNWLTQYGGGSP